MRKPIVSIGEIGVSAGDREFLFRPSLSAMDSLGSPAEIVEKFTALFEPPKINPFWPSQSYRAWERDVTSIAYDVLVACCEDDVTGLIGHMGTRWGSFVLGAMPPQDMVHLARSLMRHGIIGLKPEGLPAKPVKEYTAEFNAREFVSQAIAHLGMSTAEAWNLTMTEFSGAMQSKFGKPETLPVDEHDDAMARLAEINKLRQNQVKK
jgi:hypothetical protein